MEASETLPWIAAYLKINSHNVRVMLDCFFSQLIFQRKQLGLIQLLKSSKAYYYIETYEVEQANFLPVWQGKTRKSSHMTRT